MSDKPEHPLARKLYRQFKAGSQIMTKDDAWQIANELDAQLWRIQQLESELAVTKRAGAKLVQQVMGAVGVEALP